MAASLSPPRRAAPSPPDTPVELTAPGETRADDWFWLRDDERNNPEVLAHLAAENAWIDAQTAHLDGLSQQLYDEMVGLLPLEDESGHERFAGTYEVYARTLAGRDQPVLMRKHDDPHRSAEQLLDGNLASEGHDFWSLDEWALSPGGDKLVYAVDTDGDELHTLFIKDLASGEVEEVPGSYWGVVWSGDGKSLYYSRVDDAWRPWQLVPGQAIWSFQMLGGRQWLLDGVHDPSE